MALFIYNGKDSRNIFSHSRYHRSRIRERTLCIFILKLLQLLALLMQELMQLMQGIGT